MQRGPKQLQYDASHAAVRLPSPLPASRHTPPFAPNRPGIHFVRAIPADSDQIRVKNKNNLQTSVARFSAFRVPRSAFQCPRRAHRKPHSINISCARSCLVVVGAPAKIRDHSRKTPSAFICVHLRLKNLYQK
jgi:hypothetical protein